VAFLATLSVLGLVTASLAWRSTAGPAVRMPALALSVFTFVCAMYFMVGLVTLRD
jgi:hypothetical protein